MTRQVYDKKIEIYERDSPYLTFPRFSESIYFRIFPLSHL